MGELLVFLASLVFFFLGWFVRSVVRVNARIGEIERRFERVMIADSRRVGKIARPTASELASRGSEAKRLNEEFKRLDI